MKRVRIAAFSELETEHPSHALVANVDLVIVRWPNRGASSGCGRATRTKRSPTFRRLRT